jgi:hypothetical protein
MEIGIFPGNLFAALTITLIQTSLAIHTSPLTIRLMNIIVASSVNLVAKALHLRQVVLGQVMPLPNSATFFTLPQIAHTLVFISFVPP